MTRIKYTVSLLIALAIAQGCAANQAAPAYPAAADAPVNVEAQYEAALIEALDLQEAQVRCASRSWYADFAAAETTFENLRDADVRPILALSLERRGLSMEALNEYAVENPSFVRRQNAIAAERRAEWRGELYAVLGRFPRHGESAPMLEDESALEYSALLATPNSIAMNGDTASAKRH